VHFAALGDLFLADDRDVVFRLAGDEAGVAAHAGGKVDRHAPLVERVVDERWALPSLPGSRWRSPGLVEIDVRRGVGVVALFLDVGELLGEVALVVEGLPFLILGLDGGNLAGQRAAIHRAVFLGEGDRVALVR
jgi:hypothetical protein